MVGIATASGVQSITLQDTADYDGDGYYSNFDLAVNANTKGSGGYDDGYNGADPYFEVWIDGQLVKTTSNVARREGEFSIALSRSTLEEFDEQSSLSIEVRLLDEDTFSDDLMGSLTTTVAHEPVPESQLALESLRKYDQVYENFRTKRLSEEYWEQEQIDQVLYSIEAILPISPEDVSQDVLASKIPAGSLATDLFTVVEVGVATGTSLAAGKRFMLLNELNTNDDGDYEEFKQTLEQLEQNTKNIKSASSGSERDQYLKERLTLLETAYKQANDNQNNLRAAFSSQRQQDSYLPDLLQPIYGVQEKHYDALNGEFIKTEQALRADYVYTQTALERSGTRKLQNEVGYTPPDYPNPTVTVSAPNTAVVGEPTTISITVENTGGRAVVQTAALSFPDADASQLSISQSGVSNPNYAAVFGAGESLGHEYGAESSIEATYPLAETGVPLDGGDSFTMKVKVVPEQTGEFRIYAKSVASNGGWFAYPKVTASKPTDQQDEKVLTRTITVEEPNTPPNADDVSVLTDEGSTVSGSFDATDPDSDALSYSISDSPNYGSVSINGESFTYTPASGYAGSDSFTYQVSDGNGGTATATVEVTVDTVNTPPSANDRSVSTSEGTTVSNTFAASDPDGDTLTYSVVTAPTHGEVSISGAQFTYTPEANYAGSDSFTYEAADGNGGTATATVSISVSTTNAPPNPSDLSLSTSKGTAVSRTFDASDPDSDSLSYSVGTAPTHGEVSVTGNQFTYTPNGGYEGSDSFTYKVVDGSGGTATATVSISVSATNAAPYVNNISLSTSAGTSVSGTFNAGDPDDDSLSYTVASTPTHGSVSIREESFTYTPAPAYTGSDSFTYQVTDGNGGQATATVSVSVGTLDASPVANDVSVSTDEGIAVSDEFNASDPDGNSLSYTIVSAPSHGNVSLSGEQFTYTPDGEYAGDDAFTYRVQNGNGGSDTATVSISISATETPDSDQRLSFENGDAGETQPPNPWYILDNPGITTVSTQKASKGSTSMRVGSYRNDLAATLVGIDVKLDEVHTIVVDAYVEASNLYWGYLTVDVGEQSALIRLDNKEAGTWYRDLEADVADVSGEHTLILRAVGDGNDAYFDNIRFLNAGGEELDTDKVVVEEAEDTDPDPPIVSFASVPAEPTATEQVTFDATNSSASTGTITTYKWDFNGDGTVDATTQAPITTYTYADPGQYDASLTVVDDDGTQNTTNRSIDVVREDRDTGTAVFNITSVDAPSQVEKPRTSLSTSDFNLTVTVTNTGSREGTQTVRAAASITSSTEEVSLAPGESQIIRFSEMNAIAEIGETLEVNVETANESTTTTVAVVGQTPTFDLKQVSTNSPIQAGNPVEVTVELENTGGEIETQTISADSPGIGTAETTVQLAAGESTQRTLEVSTDPGDTGSYALTVQSADESATKQVQVTPQPAASPVGLAVDTSEADSSPGETAAITYTIDNASTQNSVTLSITDVPNDVTINEEASNFGGGTFSSEDGALLWFAPSSEMVSATIVLSIDQSASPDRTFVIQAQAEDEDGRIVDSARTDIGDIQQSIPEQYDEDSDGQLDTNEVRAGINDFAAGELTIRNVRTLINYWANGTQL
jgi:PKD repeat protein